MPARRASGRGSGSSVLEKFLQRFLRRLREIGAPADASAGKLSEFYGHFRGLRDEGDAIDDRRAVHVRARLRGVEHHWQPACRHDDVGAGVEEHAAFTLPPGITPAI